MTDLAVPDLVLSPSGEEVDTDNNPLDPCPSCGQRPHDAPEGVHDAHSAHKWGSKIGEPRWNYEHCWKCGFRPGVNQAVSLSELRKQFEAFKAFQHANSRETQTGALSADEANELKAALAESRKQEAALRAALGNPQGDEHQKIFGE